MVHRLLCVVQAAPLKRIQQHLLQVRVSLDKRVATHLHSNTSNISNSSKEMSEPVCTGWLSSVFAQTIQQQAPTRLATVHCAAASTSKHTVLGSMSSKIDAGDISSTHM
jgi:hypothetical protein